MARAERKQLRLGFPRRPVPPATRGAPDANRGPIPRGARAGALARGIAVERWVQVHRGDAEVRAPVPGEMGENGGGSHGAQLARGYRRVPTLDRPGVQGPGAEQGSRAARRGVQDARGAGGARGASLPGGGKIPGALRRVRALRSPRPAACQRVHRPAMGSRARRLRPAHGPDRGTDVAEAPGALWRFAASVASGVDEKPGRRLRRRHGAAAPGVEGGCEVRRAVATTRGGAVPECRA